MAPISGTYDAMLLYSDVTDALIQALLPEPLRPHATSDRLVFELGRQHGAGPPLMGLDFQEGKLQIPGIRAHGGEFTFKAALFFDSFLMTTSSKALGLRSTNSHFDPKQFKGDHHEQLYFKIRDVLECEVTTSNVTHLDTAKHLMNSPWIGSSTGKHSYQHAYAFSKPLSPPRALHGRLRLHLRSVILDRTYQDPSAQDGWLTLDVQGVTTHARWHLNGPTKLPS